MVVVKHPYIFFVCISTRILHKNTIFASQERAYRSHLQGNAIKVADHEEVVPIHTVNHNCRHLSVTGTKRMFCAFHRHGQPGSALHHRDQADVDEWLPVMELEPPHR